MAPIKREIIVNASLVDTRVAVLEDGALVEYLYESTRNRRIAGNIYKGRVLKILPGMQATFVDIGLAKDAFLYVRDVYEDLEEYEKLLSLVDSEPGLEEEEKEKEKVSPRPSPRRSSPSIEELLQEGQEVLVQVAREPLGTKGARITSHITLPGRYLVYMPMDRQLGVSRKISDEEERTRVRHIMERINPAGEGLIVRTVGVGKREEEFQADLAFLRTLWQRIRLKAEKLSAPALIHQDLDLIFRVIRDIFSEEVSHFIIDSPAEYERCLEYLDSMHPDLKSRLFLYTEEVPIFKSFGIEKEIEKALRRRVWLKSGGYIVIEETEALVSIDVNTGKYVGKQDFEETVLKTNLEASHEIARQVRLRDLGGIIIIDFIDMARPENRERVVEELKEGLRSDRSPTNVLYLNELGLVEMTRKRTRPGMSMQMTVPCPTCSGAGWVRSAQNIASQILREVEWKISRDH
ncbi:MAG: Rne/Rng family ribonuclease, partial [candidate division NC10 bacterium]|nr:Rne/Rng family ribonuclease [candidate division NC10 bacterium]